MLAIFVIKPGHDGIFVYLGQWTYSAIQHTCTHTHTYCWVCCSRSEPVSDAARPHMSTFIYIVCAPHSLKWLAPVSWRHCQNELMQMNANSGSHFVCHLSYELCAAAQLCLQTLCRNTRTAMCRLRCVLRHSYAPNLHNFPHMLYVLCAYVAH